MYVHAYNMACVFMPYELGLSMQCSVCVIVVFTYCSYAVLFFFFFFFWGGGGVEVQYLYNIELTLNLP